MNNKTQEEELNYQAQLNNYLSNKLNELMNKIEKIEANQLESHEKLVTSLIRLSQEIVLQIIICVVIATIIILVLN